MRYVLGVKRNLISLGTLDAQGFRLVAEGGVMKVTKGAYVSLKGRLVGSLYVLDGKVIVGSAAAVASTDNTRDDTQLWHMRMGHMSEKGLRILSSKGKLAERGIAKLEFCEHCIFGKQKRVSFAEANHTSSMSWIIYTRIFGVLPDHLRCQGSVT